MGNANPGISTGDGELKSEPVTVPESSSSIRAVVGCAVDDGFGVSASIAVAAPAAGSAGIGPEGI